MNICTCLASSPSSFPEAHETSCASPVELVFLILLFCFQCPSHSKPWRDTTFRVWFPYCIALLACALTAVTMWVAQILVCCIMFIAHLPRHPPRLHRSIFLKVSIPALSTLLTVLIVQKNDFHICGITSEYSSDIYVNRYTRVTNKTSWPLSTLLPPRT